MTHKSYPQTMLAPVLAGVAVGTMIPASLICTFYGFELTQKRKADKAGIRRWLTYEPVRSFIDERGKIQRSSGEYIDFKPILGHYMKCAEVLITLSSASLVFIPGLHLNTKLPWLAMPLVLLGCTVVTGLAFMGLLVFFYEQSLYEPANHTIFRHAVTYGLGFGALSLFALAYLLVALFVGVAVSDGATLALHI